MISKIQRVFLLIVLLSVAVECEKLVMVGGGLKDNNTDVYNAFIKLAGSASDGVPIIGIVTAASETAQENGQFYVDLFNNTYGVQNVQWIPIDVNNTKNAYDLGLATIVSRMNGIFFGGGDQTRLVTCFITPDGKDTPVLQVIRKNFNSNFTTIGGTSAGTMIQVSVPMITGGQSYQALRYGPFPYMDSQNPNLLSYYPKGGFGFFTYGYLDTHFAVRGRQGRLMAMIYFLQTVNNSKITRGIGADENTALVIVDGQGSILGGSGVYFFEYKNSSRLQENINLGASIDVYMPNVNSIYLTSGDAIDMNTWEVKFANYKQNISGAQQYDYPASISHDIFSSESDQSGNRKNPGEFTYITTDLWNSAQANATYATTYEIRPEFVLDFNQANGSAFYGTYNGTSYISYSNMKTTISQKILSPVNFTLIDNNSTQNQKSKSSFLGKYEEDQLQIQAEI